MNTSKGLDEVKKNLKKGIEVLGGNSILFEDIDSIILSAFLYNKGKITINNKDYSGEEILKAKIQYEKYLLLNKKKYVEKILFKVNKYDKALESLIKKYNQHGSIEDFNNINHIIEDSYSYDIDNYILGAVDSEEKSQELYGEYLSEKKDAFIKEIFYKLIQR